MEIISNQQNIIWVSFLLGKMSQFCCSENVGFSRKIHVILVKTHVKAFQNKQIYTFIIKGAFSIMLIQSRQTKQYKEEEKVFRQGSLRSDSD